MSLNTVIQYTFASQLPLPPLDEGQSHHDVVEQGIKVAVSLLHHPETMIIHDSSREFELIHPTDDDAVDVVWQATEFDVPINKDDNPKDGLSEWKHFRVYEDIPILFGFTKQIMFHTAIRCTDDGMEALSNAGSGVTIYGKWKVMKSETDAKCLTLSEFSDTHCNVILGWYIKSTMQKTHDCVHAYFKERFVETMRGKSWT